MRQPKYKVNIAARRQAWPVWVLGEPNGLKGIHAVVFEVCDGKLWLYTLKK